MAVVDRRQDGSLTACQRACRLRIGTTPTFITIEPSKRNGQQGFASRGRPGTATVGSPCGMVILFDQNLSHRQVTQLPIFES